MEFNIIILGVAAIVPMLTGFIWYGPMLFQNTWMKEAGVTEESMKGGNMALIFGSAYVLSLLLTMGLMPIVIHQMGIFSTLVGEPGFNDQAGEAYDTFLSLTNTYGDRFRTFKHGLFHGTITGFFIALPILGTQALFERKSFKYVAINAGYWIVTLALMGGVICQWF